MTYWPGTKIPKSRCNAFDWRNGRSEIAQDKDFRSSNSAQLTMAARGTTKSSQFTIYSKAKAKK